MSIEEARKILGSAYDAIGDEDILKIIKLFESLSNILIEKELSNN